MSVLKSVWYPRVKRFLRRVSHGLLAITLVTLVFSFCPCPAGMGMDDCCVTSGLTVSAMCCDQTAGTTAAVSPALTLVSMAARAILQSPASIEPFANAAPRVQTLIAGPRSARPILRI